MLFVQLNGLQTVKWVRTPATMTPSTFRSVTINVTTCDTVVRAFQVLTWDGGVEKLPQCYLYHQLKFKQ